ncbi:unnamed protein product, partial [Callosobruchus maculatus]
KIGLAKSENSESERQIVKFKKDIDTIGNGFEDLIFDAIDGIVKDAQLLIEADYDDGISDNSLSRNTLQKPYKLKNVLKKETERATVSLGKYRKKRSTDVLTPEKLSNIINKEADVGISSLKNFLSNLKPIKSDIEDAVKVPTKIIENLTKPANLNKKGTDLRGIADMLEELNPLHNDFGNIRTQIELQNLKNLFNSMKPKANTLELSNPINLKNLFGSTKPKANPLELSNLVKKDTNEFAGLEDSLKNLVPMKSSFANDVKTSLSHLGSLIKQGTDSVHITNVLNNLSPTAFTKMLKSSNSLKDDANSVSLKLNNNIIKEFESTTTGLLDKLIKRSKRSAASEQPVSVVEPPLINNLHPTEPKSDCRKDTNLEKQRMLELKEEVKNLHDIVVLLKDQQNAMSFLDHETKDVDDNFAQRYSKKDLLKILEHLSDSSLDEFGASKENEIPEHNTESTVHEELHKLRSDLKKAVHALNKTREIINYDKQVEKSLQDEIKRHRAELNVLKVVMEKLLKNSTNDDSEPVLGAALRQPEERPGVKFPTGRESAIPRARASDLGNLRRLLQGVIDRRNRENSLSKLLQQLSGQTPASGRDLSDENEFLRVLQLATKLFEQPQLGRIDDTDSELKRLQNAIESLRPKEEITLTDNSMTDDSQLKDLLDRLTKENSPSPIKALQNTPGPIPADRYQELLKLLQSRGRPKSPIGPNMGPHRPGSLYTPEVGYGGLSTGGTAYGPAHSSHNRYQSYRPLFYTSPPQYPRPPFTQPYEYSQPTWSDLAPVRAPSYIPYQDFEPPQALYRPPVNFGGDLPPYYKLFEEDSSQGLYRPPPSAPQSIYRPPSVPSYGIDPLAPIHRPQQNLELPPTPNFGSEPPQSLYRPQSSFGPPEKEQQSGPGGLQLFPGSGYNVPPQNGGIAQEGSATNGGEAPRLYPQTDNEGGLNGGNPELEPSYNANPPAGAVDPNVPQLPQQPNFAKPPPNSPPPGYVKKRTRRAVGPSGYPESRLYDELTNSLKKYIFEDGAKSPLYNYGQKRTEDFKAQLDHLRGSSQQRSNDYPSPYQFPMSPPQLYNPSTFMQDYTKPSILYPVTKTKPDVIATIIVKIFDHILNAVPSIVERIFGRGIYDLVNFRDYSYSNNGYNYNGQQNDLQKLFRGLGILGYGPLLFLKIIDGFTTFLNILRRNSFFRTFLLPALVLLVVAGSVIFLIWWLQPNDSNSYYNYNKAYTNFNGQSHNSNYNQPQYDQKYRQYSSNYAASSQGSQGYNSQSGNVKYPQQGTYVGNYI